MKKKSILILSLAAIIAAGLSFTACNRNELPPEPIGGQPNGVVESVRGYWSDGVYTNEFANLTFRLPNGWNYVSREQLDEMTANAQASPNNPDPNSERFFEMIARAESGETSIVMVFEPLSPSEIQANYSAKEFLDGIMLTYQRRPGIYYISEMFEKTFGGNEYYAFYVALSQETTLTYFARIVDGYSVSISVLRLELYDVLSYFS